MSRDIREAGGNPCTGGDATVVNQLQTAGDAWWTAYANGIRGYDGDDAMTDSALGTGTGQRATGTDAIEVHGTDAAIYRVTAHAAPNAALSLNAVDGIAADDVLLVCNNSYVFVFEATGVGGTDVQHAEGGAGSGNCSDAFVSDTTQCATDDADVCFMVPDPSAPPGTCTNVVSGELNPPNTPAFVAHPQTVRWFVRNNADGTGSLVRQVVRNRPSAGGGGDVQTDEIAQGVEDIDFTYLVAGANAYVQEAAVADWSQVISVRAELTLQGSGSDLGGTLVQGTDGAILQRSVVNVIALRNRESLQ
jgi:type IV pilus assembly protein PilW